MSSQQTNYAISTPVWQQLVHRHVEALDYGSVEIVIHDSKIVHMHVKERFRIGNKRAVPGSTTSKNNGVTFQRSDLVRGEV